jgi:hypothetical protein
MVYPLTEHKIIGVALNILFFGFLICLPSIATAGLEGYWAKYLVIKESNTGEVTKSYQVKELLNADIDNNEYLVRTSYFNADGSVEVEEEIEDDFTTPERGQQIVSNCNMVGGNPRLRQISVNSMETCEFEEGISFAAIPFGLFEFKWSLEVEYPNGEFGIFEITNLLVEFGKK